MKDETRWKLSQAITQKWKEGAYKNRKIRKRKIKNEYVPLQWWNEMLEKYENLENKKELNEEMAKQERPLIAEFVDTNCSVKLSEKLNEKDFKNEIECLKKSMKGESER